LSGLAGEYFVAAELSRRDYVVTLTLRNTKTFDILVSNISAIRVITIQVKTSQLSKRDWVLRDKAEELFSDSLFYVFVNLNGISNQPTYHIVPGETVAGYCRENHFTWLNTPGKQGQPHNDNTIRKFSDKEGKYLDAWNLLGL
jgi:hypothetical protein